MSEAESRQERSRLNEIYEEYQRYIKSKADLTDKIAFINKVATILKGYKNE